MNKPLGNADSQTIIDYVKQIVATGLPELPNLWATTVPLYDGDISRLLEQAKETQQRLFDALASTVEPPHVLLLALQQHTAQVCVRVAMQSFKSYQQASAASQALNDLITAVLEYAPLRERYTVIELSAWNDLRVKIADAIRQQQMILPVINHVSIDHDLPAVVIAHRLFQNADKADELIKQNEFEHPGFCSGSAEYFSRNDE